MLYTKDLTNNTTAVLENAYDVSYEKTLNKLWTASFSLPGDDPKIEKVKQLQYVEVVDESTNEYIGLFRVLPKIISKTISNNSVTFELEHVMGTLLGSVLFKHHQFTGFSTREVLSKLLDYQEVKHWKLGSCDFSRNFDYLFENENLLSCIISIPEQFDESYMWEFDTKSYPWTLSLKKPETIYSSRIIEGYNLEAFEIEENPNSIWNKIFPLGAGEGVNQIDIKKINNGVPYIEDIESQQKHGIYATIIADKRFTTEKTLLAHAKSKLSLWKKPFISWKIKAVDLSSLTGIKFDELRHGRVVKVVLDDYGEQDLLIIKEEKRDFVGKPTEIDLELGSITTTLASASAEQTRKQQVNDVYSQGATNWATFVFQDNCDSNIPGEIDFYIPDDVVYINSVELTYKTKKFRAYSGTMATGGQSTQSSSSGGGSTQTSSETGEHRHRMMVKEIEFTEGQSIPVTDGNVTIENDIVTYTANGASIGLFRYQTLDYANEIFTDEATGNHNHSIQIPDHSHSVNIPGHTHEVSYQLTEKGELPTKIDIEIDGAKIPGQPTEVKKMDLTQYLVGEDGTIKRDFHNLKLILDKEARIEATIILTLFIQSQKGDKY